MGHGRSNYIVVGRLYIARATNLMNASPCSRLPPESNSNFSDYKREFSQATNRLIPSVLVVSHIQERTPLKLSVRQSSS